MIGSMKRSIGAPTINSDNGINRIVEGTSVEARGALEIAELLVGVAQVLGDDRIVGYQLVGALDCALQTV